MALLNSSTLYLSFLRPSALPQASTIHRFFSTSSTTTTSSSPMSDSPSKSSAPFQPPTLPQTEGAPTEKGLTNKPKPQILSYRVNRTASTNLPVYLDTKRGGNLKQTKLQKIEGDINALKVDLQKELKLGDKEIAINQLTHHIIIRGFRKPEVTSFLQSRGF